MKIPVADVAVDKQWKTLEKLLAWQLTKVSSKKEVNLEATLMDVCHLKKCGVRTYVSCSVSTLRKTTQDRMLY